MDLSSFKVASKEQSATIKEANEIVMFRAEAGLPVGPIVAIQSGTAMGAASVLGVSELGGTAEPLFLHIQLGESSFVNVGLQREFIKNGSGDALRIAENLFQSENPGQQWDIRKSDVAITAARKALAKYLPKV